MDKKELDKKIENAKTDEDWDAIEKALNGHAALELDPDAEGDEKLLGELIKDPPEGIHCHLCLAKSTEAKLCAVNGTGNIVPFGTLKSWIECLNLSDCKGRREKKWKGDYKNDRDDYYNDNYKGGNYSGNYSGQDTIEYVKCRHEATEAFSIGDMHFFGGSEEKVLKQVFDKQKWLVVSLLGRTKSEPLWCRVKSWMDTLKPFTSTAQITIDWTDMSAPPLQPGFWTRLVALAKKEKFTNVLFYCIGGHGRTGTALASVLIECAEVVPSEAITFVRKYYCKEAVETKSQIEYLARIGVAAGLMETVAAKKTKQVKKEGNKK